MGWGGHGLEMHNFTMTKKQKQKKKKKKKKKRDVSGSYINNRTVTPQKSKYSVFCCFGGTFSQFVTGVFKMVYTHQNRHMDRMFKLEMLFLNGQQQCIPPLIDESGLHFTESCCLRA